MVTFRNPGSFGLKVAGGHGPGFAGGGLPPGNGHGKWANGWNLLRWGLTARGSDTFGTSNATTESTRGGGSPPEPEEESNSTACTWSWAYQRLTTKWWIRIWANMLLQVAENGLHYCGTLCASIGLAARWSYRLLIGVVLVFLLELLVWTYTWVIHPARVHSRALPRYCRGTGTWSDVTRLQGHRPFIPVSKGPGTHTPWTAQYVQGEVRSRGPNRCPVDLLVGSRSPEAWRNSRVRMSM